MNFVRRLETLASRVLKDCEVLEGAQFVELRAEAERALMAVREAAGDWSQEQLQNRRVLERVDLEIRHKEKGKQ
jgi:hypothetical protein